MKYYGLWTDYGRVISGLLNGTDIDAFLYKYDPNEETSWYTEVEDPADSAAIVYTLEEAIAEYEEFEKSLEALS